MQRSSFPASTRHGGAHESELGALALAHCERAHWILDYETLRILWANRTALALFRTPALDELVERDLALSPATRSLLTARRARPADSWHTQETWSFQRGGEPCTLPCLVRDIVLPDGRRALLAESFASDAQPLHRSEPESVQAGDERFHSLCMQAPIGVIQLDADGRCRFVNAHWSALTGLPRERALEAGWLSAVHPDDCHAFQESWEATFAQRAEGMFRFRFRKRDGAVAWATMQAAPITAEDGSFGGYLAVLSDATEFIHSEQRFALLFEQSKEAHLVLDPEGRIVDCNHSALELFAARDKRALIGLSPLALSPPTQADGRSSGPLAAEIHAYIIEHGGHRFDWTLRRLDGTDIPVEAAVNYVCLDGERAFFYSLHDNTDHVRARQAILRSREEALAASRVKSQFLANMSHEIRTPMNGVLGMLLLVLGTDLNSEQRAFVSAAQASAEGLLEIINDILDLSKIEAGKLTIERVNTSLEDILRGSLQTTALRAHAKAVELVVRVAQEVPRHFVADPVRVRQVLTNLIGNAVKFTDEGQIEVAVSLTTDSGVQQLLFAVADSGIGIAPERQRHIFDAFQQADNSTTRRYGGTGLGLTICKELVAAMGGKMGLVSTKGHGSTFSFTLPLEVKVTIRSLPTQTILVGRTVLLIEDHPVARSSLKDMLEHHGAKVLAAADLEQAQALLQRSSVAIDVALIDDTLPAQECRELPPLLKRMPACRAARFVMLRSRERLGRAALGAAGFDFALDKPLLAGDLENALSAPLDETPTTRRFAALPTRDMLIGPRALDVLIVEDHPVNAHFLSSLLRRSGHRVVHASNGVRALSAVSGHLFDIILMDVQMPEMDGLEATRRIREGERGGERRTPIVALTANAMKGDEQECIAAGMDAYIAKPIDPDLLRKTLARLIAPSVPPSGNSTGMAPALPLRAAEPALPTAPPFARDALLERACGDPRFEADLIRIFVDTQEEMVRDVDHSVESGDLNAVRHAAHRLKGALLLVCAGPAAALALELEKAAREGQRAPMPELLRGLKREMLRLRSALGDVVGGGSS